jgi:hypothetical protein
LGDSVTGCYAEAGYRVQGTGYCPPGEVPTDRVDSRNKMPKWRSTGVWLRIFSCVLACVVVVVLNQ